MFKNFSGINRRFQVTKNISVKGGKITLIDDYGHHPAEIHATLATAKSVWPERRLIVVFQPHRFSRTFNLLESFYSSFNDADKLILLDIYAAGEKPIEGINSRKIAQGIREFGHKHVDYIEKTDTLVPHLKNSLHPGDVVLTLGAGNIGELAHKLAAEFRD